MQIKLFLALAAIGMISGILSSTTSMEVYGQQDNTNMTSFSSSQQMSSSNNQTGTGEDISEGDDKDTSSTSMEGSEGDDTD